eukprot:SAG11_NODE_1475_length_4838_cov_3.412956_2_plen_74_part_00
MIEGSANGAVVVAERPAGGGSGGGGGGGGGWLVHTNHPIGSSDYTSAFEGQRTARHSPLVMRLRTARGAAFLT